MVQSFGRRGLRSRVRYCDHCTDQDSGVIPVTKMATKTLLDCKEFTWRSFFVITGIITGILTYMAYRGKNILAEDSSLRASYEVSSREYSIKCVGAKTEKALLNFCLCLLSYLERERCRSRFLEKLLLIKVSIHQNNP